MQARTGRWGGGGDHFREVSVKAKFACDDVSSECAEVSRGEEGK